MPENKILISLSVDDQGTVKLKQFGDETAKVAEQGKTGLAGLADGWVGVTAKITAATAAIYAAGRIVNSFVKEAAEADEIQHRLGYTVQAAGYSWEYYKSQIDIWAGSIMKATRYTNDEAKQALNDMFLYTNNMTKAQQGATMAMDLAARKNMDLGSAARYVGMGMSGNIEMLGKMLPEFKNLSETLGQNVSMSEKAAYFMKIFQEKFGGTAQADIETYSGKVKQFSNSWTELKKSIGTDLLPPLSNTFDWLKKIVDKMHEQREEAKAGQGWLETWGYFSPQKKDLWASFGGGSLTEQMRAEKEAKKDVFPPKEYPIMKVAPDSWDYFKKAPGFIEIINDGVVKEVISVKSLDEALTNEIMLKQQLMDLAPKMDRWEMEAGYLQPSGYVRDADGRLISLADAVERNKVLEDFKNIQKSIIDSWEFEGAEPLGQISARKQAQQVLEKGEQMDLFWADTATRMGQSFTSGFFNIFTSGLKNAGASFKQFGVNMLNSFTNVVQEMISNWLVFGSFIGSSGFTSGQKFGGLLGLFNIFKAQEGFFGMVNRPTGFIAGENGRELVNIIPEGKISGISGGGQTTYVFISAIDTQSFDQALAKSSGRVVKIVKKNIDSNGPLRGR